MGYNSVNFNTIFKTFLSYLPSRILVVLNSVIIVPVLAHIMCEKDIGIFQLAIGVLNLVCTCSTDWIAKSALRFYEKYKLSDRLGEFFSNLVWLTIFMYFLIAVLFFVFKEMAFEKLFIPDFAWFITLLIVLPVGIRQFLYQMLRVLNRPFLYSFSIITYQLSLLVLFLVLSGFMPKLLAVLLAMGFAVLCIDVYLLKSLNLKIGVLHKVNPAILAESLKYALPQIITNTSIWTILNINRFVFQYEHYFSDTAVAGVAWLYATSILSPVFSTFSFAVFPEVVKKFESKSRIKPFMTNTIQLYCALFMPVAAVFCCYSKIIERLAFGDKYPQAWIVLAFFAMSLFIHELMKLFNIRYHLQNKTYVEMAVSLLIGLTSLVLNYFLIIKYHLAGAGIAMLISISLLFTLNLFIQIRNSDYVSYLRIIKTGVISCVICGISFVFAEILFLPFYTYNLGLLQIILYLFFCYILSFAFARKLLG